MANFLLTQVESNPDVLGTAAAANLTTSPTDTTTGSVLKVGDFGLGEIDAPTSIPTDNTAIPSGLYRETSGAVFPAFSCVLDMNYSDKRSAQIAASTQAGQPNRFFGRTQNIDNSWELPVEFYHSGNSVNPLDFGIGTASQPTLLLDSSEALISGSYGFNSSDPSAPEGLAGTFTVNSSSPTRIHQIALTNATNRMFIRWWNGVVFSGWDEFYTSGNSVNPLDFGLGETGVPPVLPDIESTSIGTGFYGTNAGSFTGTNPTNRTLNSVVQFRDTSRQYQMLFNVDQRFLFRVEQGSWNEVYHSGNPNHSIVENSAAQTITREAPVTEVFDRSGTATTKTIGTDYGAGDKVVIHKTRSAGQLVINTTDAVLAPDSSNIGTQQIIPDGTAATLELLRTVSNTWEMRIY